MKDAISVRKLEFCAKETIIIFHGASHKGIESVIVNLNVFLVEWDPFAANQFFNLNFESKRMLK